MVSKNRDCRRVTSVKKIARTPKKRNKSVLSLLVIAGKRDQTDDAAKASSRTLPILDIQVANCLPISRVRS